MNQISDDQTPDLQEIGAQLSRAIRRDHGRHSRRRSLARATTVLLASTVALSGTALAAGELTGAVDLGGGHSAVPVSNTPAPPDRLPYRYELTGVHRHNGQGNGTVYIESSRSLTRLTQAELAATREGCGSQAMTVDGATVWVLDTACASEHP